MEGIRNDKILMFRPDAFEAVRSSVGLEQPGRMAEAVDILEEWVKKQPHFTKRDFSREYLERTLLAAKGYVERAKQKLDKLCTLKSLLPEYFTYTSNSIPQFKRLGNIMPAGFLPMTGDDHYRIFSLKVISDDYNSADVLTYYKYIMMVFEYLLKNDYSAGLKLVADFRDANILKVIRHVNPVLLRHVCNIVLEGYGMRIKSVFMITESKMVGGLLSLFKPILSEKIFGRIQVLDDEKALYEHIPQELLPAEYGGQQRSLKVLYDDWIEILTSQDFLDYYKEMAAAVTHEDCRPTGQFNLEHLGMPGSFRVLSVD